MRSRIQAIVLPSEAGEFGDEVHRIFTELGRASGEGLTGECSPAVDIYETDNAVEITMDLPDVDRDSVRIVAKGQTIVIAGEKAPRRGRGDSTFHLVERGYGRFARVVRLTSACDTGRAHATLVNGELRVTLPRISEQRGRTLRIALADGQPVA
ncbi:MAG: Hsp20 family protein [Luteitalea sp.]|nr:Hsp20 family protein [Luteitalea sp.]